MPLDVSQEPVEEARQLCRNCGLTTTADERLAVTCNAEKCPACGGYVGDDQNCRVGGGGCGK